MNQPARQQPARGQAVLGQAAGEQTAGEQGRRQQPGRQPILRRLCPPVLVFEAVVIVLAIPVAITIEHLHGSVAGAVGGGLAAVAVILAGVVGRARWGLVAGSALQVLIIASGIVIPAMYALGVIFAALWATAIWLARRLEQRLRDLRTQAGHVTGLRAGGSAYAGIGMFTISAMLTAPGATAASTRLAAVFAALAGGLAPSLAGGLAASLAGALGRPRQQAPCPR